jgi:hemoglobin/transferrin/lactoferrin receptor protein
MGPVRSILGILILSLIVYQTSVGQQITVLDQGTGQPVENVALFNKDKSISAISDAFGKADLGSFAENDSIFLQHSSYELCGYNWHELVFGSGQVRLKRRNIMMEEFVVSAVKGKENKEETPYMIDVLGPEQLETTAYQTGADILLESGNVMVQKSQGGGGSPILRGFEANKILLVVDGVRMNNAIYRSGHLQNSITIDNSILDRVEILFGPSSIIYGSDALGGVIHYYTRDPEYNASRASVYGQFSTANLGKIIHGDFNIGKKKIANTTSLTYSDFGDIHSGENRKAEWGDWGQLNHYVSRIGDNDSTIANPKPHIQKNTGYRQLDLLSKTSYAPSALLDLYLNLQLSTSSLVDRFDQLNDYEGDNLKYAEWYYGPQNRFLSSLQAVYKKNNPLFTNLTATVAFQKIDEDRITRKFRVDDKLFQDEDVFVYSATFDFTRLMKKGHRLFYGLEVNHNDVRSSARYENIINGSITEAITRYPGGGSHTNSFSAYGNYKMLVNPKVILNMGLRYHYGMLRSTFTDSNMPFEDIKINNGALTGSASVVFSPQNTWKYRFIFATGFRNPNVDDYGKVRAKGSFVTIPNEDLEPEYTYNLEIGISKSFPGVATISGAVWFTYLNNAIVRANHSLNGSDSMPYDGEDYRIITNANASLATIQGISLNLNSALRGNFYFKGSFNYLRGRDITNGVPLAHIPPIFGRFSAGYIYRKFNTEAYVAYSGRKYWSELSPYGEDNEDEAIADFGFPAWSTISLRTQYKINERFLAQLAIQNILNRYYKVFASGVGAPGRNFVLTFRANF